MGFLIIAKHVPWIQAKLAPCYTRQYPRVLYFSLLSSELFTDKKRSKYMFFSNSGPFASKLVIHTKMWWHWIYRFMTFFLETENSMNSHNLIPLIRQVLDFAPVKVSLKLHFSCVHLMKGNQKIANFYEKKK